MSRYDVPRDYGARDGYDALNFFGDYAPQGVDDVGEKAYEDARDMLQTENEEREKQHQEMLVQMQADDARFCEICRGYKPVDTTEAVWGVCGMHFNEREALR